MPPPPHSTARTGAGADADADEEARLRQLKADISALVTRATEQQAALATERADVERAIAQLAMSQPVRTAQPSPLSSRSITPTPRRPQPGRTPSRLRILQTASAAPPPSRPSSAPPPYSAAVAPPASSKTIPRRPPASRKSSSSRRLIRGVRPSLGQRKSSEQSTTTLFGRGRDPARDANDTRAARALWASLFLPRHEAYPGRGKPVWGGSLDTYAIELERGRHAPTTYPFAGGVVALDEPGPTSDWGESDSESDSDWESGDAGDSDAESAASHDTVCYRRVRDPFQGDQCACSRARSRGRPRTRGRDRAAASTTTLAPRGFRDARLGLFCPWCARNGHTEANCHDKAANRPSWAARRQTFIAARDAAKIHGRPQPTALMEPWPLQRY